MEVTLFSSFLAGLLGSAHCVGMCGGIMGFLTMSLPKRHSWLYLLTYNLGRIGTYTIAGVFAGGLGAYFVDFLPLDNPYRITRWISGVLMIALGIYIGAWGQVFLFLEKMGTVLWKRIEPFGRRWLPVRTLWQAFGLGAIWGWLPCGLVYGTLILSFACAHALRGGMLMFAFGMGTLPMLLTVSVTWKLTRIIQHRLIRKIAGIFIIFLGLLILFR